MNKIMALTAVFLSFAALNANAQWNNGVLIDVQEINITRMRTLRISGAEAVMKVIEQYADRQYRFAFVSPNYLIPAEQKKYFNADKNRFMVAVAGYPAANNMLYTQVFFNQSFFLVVLAKNETDMIKQHNIQIIRMNYDRGNSVRRNNVRDTIQRNNTIPLGIDTAER